MLYYDRQNQQKEKKKAIAFYSIIIRGCLDVAKQLRFGWLPFDICRQSLKQHLQPPTGHPSTQLLYLYAEMHNNQTSIHPSIFEILKVAFTEYNMKLWLSLRAMFGCYFYLKCIDVK